MKNGLILINLGSSDNPSPAAVRKYLAEFLADKRLINLPGLLRYSLLYGAILPFRPRRSEVAYQKIWTEQGSPLICNSQNLAAQLQNKLGSDWIVALGMRYGSPTLSDALTKLIACEHITILPLFPQYSSAASGSAIEAILKLLSAQENIPSFTLIRDFHQYPPFIKAQSQAKNLLYLTTTTFYLVIMVLLKIIYSNMNVKPYARILVQKFQLDMPVVIAPNVRKLPLSWPANYNYLPHCLMKNRTIR